MYRIKEILEDKDMLAGDSDTENIFYASDLSENFINMINTIFKGVDMHVEFKNLEPDSVDQIK